MFTERTNGYLFRGKNYATYVLQMSERERIFCLCLPRYVVAAFFSFTFEEVSSAAGQHFSVYIGHFDISLGCYPAQKRSL